MFGSELDRKLKHLKTLIKAGFENHTRICYINFYFHFQILWSIFAIFYIVCISTLYLMFSCQGLFLFIFCNKITGNCPSEVSWYDFSVLWILFCVVGAYFRKYFNWFLSSEDRSSHLTHSLKIPSQKTYFLLLYALFTQKQKVQVWPNRPETTLGVYLTHSSTWKESDSKCCRQSL